MTSPFTPDRPEGAEFHRCERCEGTGTVTVLGEDVECTDCDGTGEWFE